jgi:hypothetical protein
LIADARWRFCNVNVSPHRGRVVSRPARAVSLLAAVVLAVGSAWAAGAGPNGPLLPLPGKSPPVTLTINPDGSASWNGEALSGVPAIKNKLATRTLQDPKLELDLFFHTAPGLGDSNRQTLLEVLRLAARFGFVHLEKTDTGVRLILLGPTAASPAPK